VEKKQIKEEEKKEGSTSCQTSSVLNLKVVLPAHVGPLIKATILEKGENADAPRLWNA